MTDSPLADLDGRRARLAQRVPQIAPSAVHEYVAVPVEHLDLGHDEAEAAPLGAVPAPDDPRWVPLEVGASWGRTCELMVWGYPADGGEVTWLRARVEVPAGWAGDDVLLGLDDPRLGTGPDAAEAIGFEAVVHLDGAVLAGMDDQHRQVRLPDDAPGRTHEVTVRATTAARRSFAGLRLLRRHRDTYALGVLAQALLGVADTLAQDDLVGVRIVEGLDAVYRSLDLTGDWNSPALRHSATTALPALRELAASLAGPDAGDGAADRPLVTATGHAHLDVAWLWPVWRTRQKVAHTVATALNLMDHYPDYHFSLSAPQTWQFVADDDPELFARMVQRAREGRLEPVGVFWLESDGTLPSAESFVRQVRHGVRFYAEHLDQVPDAAWLPDSFGFTAALPTVLAACGVRTLLTTKLSWNRTNRMPADTFRWRGPDGTAVLAHFVTASAAPAGHPADPVTHTYAGDMSPAEVAGLWRHYRDRSVSEELLYLYGHGDGGGGPTEQMVATAGALADVAHLPRVRPGRAAGFFARLAGALDHPRLTTWSGDLYLEAHRGTLTSQRATKRGNRDGELALREAEWADAWAVAGGARSRLEELDEAWEALLRNQFHDVLPGSGIPRVPADAAVEHAGVVAAANALRDAVLAGPDPQRAAPVAVNALPWDRSGVVRGPDGDLVAVRDVPALGVGRLVEVSAPADGVAGVRVHAEGTTTVLDNGLVRAVLDADGEVESLAVAGGASVAAPGARLNRLVVSEDRPLFWDAWDVDAFHADKAEPVPAAGPPEPFEEGPMRAGVRVRRRVGSSTVVQTLALTAGSPVLEVTTEVDWQERQRLLRVLFPLAVNARHATLGRQVGSIEVAVHRNTSWERARFEVPAHGWCAVADGGGGLALLTDALHGHSVVQTDPAGTGADPTAPSGTTVGLSLLKAGAWPDPGADTGVHLLRYGLLPFAGTWAQAQVPRTALELAVPLRLGRSDRPTGGLLRTEGLDGVDHVIAETVKAAWDGDGLVVRLHESHNRPGRVRLVLDRPVRAVRRCDALERDLTDPAPRPAVLEEDGSVLLDVAPYELVTLRLQV